MCVMGSSDFFKNFKNQIRSSNHVESNDVCDDVDDERRDMLDMIDKAAENKDGVEIEGAYTDDFDVAEEMKNIEYLSRYDITSNSQPQSITSKSKKVPVLDYVFTPKSDITVYELARLLSFINMSIDQNVFDNMPVELKKHFTKCID